MVHYVLRLLRGRATGAVVAQGWQAIGSFGLQLLAAWLLGASGLGRLSLCLSIIVLATAAISGMVGDSLVVLDRHSAPIRGGLQFWALALAVGSLILVVGGMTVSNVLSPLEATLMGLALVAFQLEELVRRIFMATMRFWFLVIIDSAAVVTALTIVGVWSAGHQPQLSTFFVGLLVGQIVGLAVGIAMLPNSERRLVSLRGAAIRNVAGFGIWRGLQVSVAPAVLTGMRVIVTGLVGAAALGQIELARIYVAPALLSVQGLGSYLLSTYVRDQKLPLADLVRRAWRAALGMMGAAVLIGAAVTVFVSSLSDVISGPGVAVDRLTVVGWVAYVAASASCQPFASLAAARGRPARVFRCRLVDAVLALGLLLVLLAVGVSAAWVPFVLAGGLFTGGVLVRQFALKPLLHPTLGQPTDPRTPRTSYALR